jgi:integrase
MALTVKEIEAAKPNAKPFTLFDGQGLYLLIQPNGSKLWRWKYRYEGKPRLIAFGQYPDISLATARDRHAAARAELNKGHDPSAQRKAHKDAAKAQDEAAKAEAAAEQDRAANSFKAIALKWHEWWSKGVDADTAAYILRRLEADVFPAFGHLPIDTIKAAEVRKLILRIEQERGARDVAQRQHGTISQIFRYAVTHDLAENNPAAAFKPSDVLAPRRPQHRAHIAPSQLPTLLVAMDDYSGHAVWRSALKLMALTFVRSAELLQAPWSEFDLDNARWTITAQRMKMDKPHIVPLPRQAVAILRELKQLAGDKQFVFPGMNKQTANGTINCNTLLNVLNEIGYKGAMTGHGFRGLARTVLAENGFEKAHVELQLSHSNDDKVEAAYNHAQYLPQRVQMMQWWADYLDTELAKGRHKVVAIRKTA